MSVIPSTPHRLPVRRTPRSTEHLAPRGQKRPRSAGSPYVPGMFDALIDHPVLGRAARPEQVRSVTVELAASGRSVIVAEHLHSGAGPRHLLSLDEPHSVFMRLADGREVWIEVRAVEPAAEEDREPWSEEEELAIESAYDSYGGGNGNAADNLDIEPLPPVSVPIRTFMCLDFLPR